MEPEYSKETLDAERPPLFNRIVQLEHQIRELKAENVVLRSKMEHARAILKSDQIAPDQEEIKRQFNPSGLWEKYNNAKANY